MFFRGYRRGTNSETDRKISKRLVISLMLVDLRYAIAFHLELHQQRLEYLKKQLHLARRENWRYPSFDSIFSGHFHN